MDVEEQNIEDLFDDENPSDIEEGAYENDNRDREVSGANLELGDGDKEGDANATSDAVKAKLIKPKRNMAKQPLLNADRILGKRGIRVLEKMFEDFEPREGKEFEDLDIVIDRMQHWAHRLYPKLPFDDVTKQILHVGKKMQVQTNVKKIRMGEDLDPIFTTDVNGKKEILNSSDDEEPPKNDEDEVERYDNEPQEDVFEQLIREGDERMAQKEGHNPNDLAILNGSQTQDNQDLPNYSSQTLTSKPALSEEQKQRMLKNRELAEEKRRQRLAEKSQTLLAEDSRIEDEDEK